MLDKNINLEGNSDMSLVKKEQRNEKRTQAKVFIRPYKTKAIICQGLYERKTLV